MLDDSIRQDRELSVRLLPVLGLGRVEGLLSAECQFILRAFSWGAARGVQASGTKDQANVPLLFGRGLQRLGRRVRVRLVEQHGDRANAEPVRDGLGEHDGADQLLEGRERAGSGAVSAAIRLRLVVLEKSTRSEGGEADLLVLVDDHLAQVS